jgi:hypothetical protein
VEGVLEDFLGVHIKTLENATYELSQSRLIELIITEVFGDSPPSTTKDIPCWFINHIMTRESFISLVTWNFNVIQIKDTKLTI